MWADVQGSVANSEEGYCVVVVQHMGMMSYCCLPLMVAHNNHMLVVVEIVVHCYYLHT